MQDEHVVTDSLVLVFLEKYDYTFLDLICTVPVF